MVSERALIILMIACLASVGIAAGIRVHQESFRFDVPISVVPRHERIQTDTDFFDKGSDEHATLDEGRVVGGAASHPSKIAGVTAAGYLIGDAKSGRIYDEYNSRSALPVASMSKLVTAFVATDMMSATSTIEVTDDSLRAPPDKSNLANHEKFVLADILHPLLLNSSNIAAEAIASSTGDRVAFMEMMRSYAWEVGMPTAFFADPSGVSPENVATARDIFGLASYLVTYRPDILAITRIASTTVATTTDHGSHVFQSTHPFVMDPRFVGGKTGRTPEAGETMVTIMDIDSHQIAIIVLGSRDRETDTRILLRNIETKLSRSY